ncbi:hypothetical protein GQ457_13G000520 [Hibiscus cannabinus]
MEERSKNRKWEKKRRRAYCRSLRHRRPEPPTVNPDGQNVDQDEEKNIVRVQVNPTVKYTDPARGKFKDPKSFPYESNGHLEILMWGREKRVRELPSDVLARLVWSPEWRWSTAARSNASWPSFMMNVASPWRANPRMREKGGRAFERRFDEKDLMLVMERHATWIHVPNVSYFDLSSLGTNEQVTMADSASVDQSLIFDLASSNEQISPRQVTRRLIITLFRIWYHWVRVTKPPWQTQHRLIRTQRRLTRVLLPICVIGYEWTGRFNRLSIVTTAGFVSFDRDFILILHHRVRMSRIYF